jgi:hypothetical protein
MKDIHTQSAQQLKAELEKVNENWNKYIGLVGKIQNKEVREKCLDLCTEIKDRLSVAPASTQTKYIGAFMGGLVKSSLQTVKLMNSINKTYDHPIDLDSVLVCGLFSAIGKVGNLKEDLYTPKDSQWHTDRGIMFDYNEKVGAIPYSVRSIWWLTSSGVPLSLDEINAIHSLSTMNQAKSSSELYDAPPLSLLLQHAYQMVCSGGTDKKSVLD